MLTFCITVEAHTQRTICESRLCFALNKSPVQRTALSLHWCPYRGMCRLEIPMLLAGCITESTAFVAAKSLAGAQWAMEEKMQEASS